MENFDFIIPLTKVDEEKRLIIGRAVHEVPDKSGEIIDYATAVPAFKAWSKQYEDATGGLSKGNLRVMHGKQVAGKITDISFNDKDKAIDVVAKVVDDNEWKKVMEGVYTGFSVGGSYAKKWEDGDLKRYTPKVTELSLVDSPCIPSCKFFELHKADGSVEEVPFKEPVSEEIRSVVRDMIEERLAKASEEAKPELKTFADLMKSVGADGSDRKVEGMSTFNELLAKRKADEVRVSAAETLEKSWATMSSRALNMARSIVRSADRAADSAGRAVGRVFGRTNEMLSMRRAANPRFGSSNSFRMAMRGGRDEAKSNAIGRMFASRRPGFSSGAFSTVPDGATNSAMRHVRSSTIRGGAMAADRFRHDARFAGRQLGYKVGRYGSMAGAGAAAGGAGFAAYRGLSSGQDKRR